jgi:hypothetical protein
MKNIVKTYLFNKTAKTVTLSNYTTVDLDSILAILNETVGVIIYKAASPTLKATVATNVITLNASVDTSAMADTDKLTILYWDADTVDNQPQATVTRPAIVGGQARDLSTYVPGYSAGDAVQMLFDLTGALKVIQANLDITRDSVSAFSGYNSLDSNSPVIYRNTALSNTKLTVVAAPANLYGWMVFNASTDAAYIKVWNNVIASVTVGTTVPDFIIHIPAGTALDIGKTLEHSSDSFKYCSAGIVIAATKLLADNDATAPTAALNTIIWYK